MSTAQRLTADERVQVVREALEAALPLGMRIALPRDLDEMARTVAEDEDYAEAGLEELAALARGYGDALRVRIGVDAAAAALGDVLGVLRSAEPDERETLRSVIGDRVAELLCELASGVGEGVPAAEA